MADPPVLTSDIAKSWFTDHVPDDWFSELQVLIDRDEIMVIGTLAPDDESDDSDDGRRERIGGATEMASLPGPESGDEL